jgi:hypothetical protein
MINLPFPTSPDSSASRAYAITPANSDLATPVRAIYVGGAGNVQITDPDGNVTIFYNVPAGTILPVMIVRVSSTNTTATNIVGLA